MKVAPSRSAFLLRRATDDMSTGQGSSLRRRAAKELAAASPPVPQWRAAGLNVQRLGRQVAVAPKAAEASVRAVEAVAGPLQKIQLLTVKLLERSRELPARDAVFQACRPLLLRALGEGAALSPNDRRALLLSVDRLAVTAPRAQVPALSQWVQQLFKPQPAEVAAALKLRPSAFLQSLQTGATLAAGEPPSRRP